MTIVPHVAPEEMHPVKLSVHCGGLYRAMQEILDGIQRYTEHSPKAIMKGLGDVADDATRNPNESTWVIIPFGSKYPIRKYAEWTPGVFIECKWSEETHNYEFQIDIAPLHDGTTVYRIYEFKNIHAARQYIMDQSDALGFDDFGEDEFDEKWNVLLSRTIQNSLFTFGIIMDEDRLDYWEDLDIKRWGDVERLLANRPKSAIGIIRNGYEREAGVLVWIKHVKT